MPPPPPPPPATRTEAEASLHSLVCCDGVTAHDAPHNHRLVTVTHAVLRVTVVPHRVLAPGPQR
eukprot:COSAG01_NODE_5093_length_4492_cov_15.651719_4_plen_64_part_00